MTDVTSEKLYSKLDRINRIKRDLKATMINVGGYEYFENDPLFEEYPRILGQIHRNISAINSALDVSIYGRDPGFVLTKADTTFKTFAPYLEELQICRSLLIDNLNTRGVTASTDDSLRDLVGKVLDIEGSKEPYEKELLSFMLDDYFRVDISRVGTYNGTSFYEYIRIMIVNVDDEDHSFDDPFYRFYFYDTDNGDTLSTVMIRTENIYSHSSYEGPNIMTSLDGDTSNIDRFTELCENGKMGWYTNAFYKSNCRVDTIPFEDLGDIKLETYQINEWSYFFWCYTLGNDTSSQIVEGQHTIYMYSPDGNRKYNLGRTWEDGSRFWIRGWYWWYYNPQSDTQRIDMKDTWRTNTITLERDD